MVNSGAVFRTSEKMKMLAESKKPKIVFNGLFYKISVIPLNFRIDINPGIKLKHPKAGIDRDCYCDLETGIEKAHEIAKSTIEEYFRMPV